MSRLSNCDRNNTQQPHQQQQSAATSRTPQATPHTPVQPPQPVGTSRLQTSASSSFLNQIVNTSSNVENSRLSANLPFVNSSNSSNNIYFTSSTLSTPPSLITTPNANIASFNASTSLTPTSHLNPATSPVAKKRLKLDGSVLGVSVTNSGTQEDFFALKKRILDHKYLKLKSLKDKHSEHVAELFYLQSNGNMMDYQTWRKKNATPQFVNFCKTYRLDETALDDADALKLISHHYLLSQGAEIKIPGVGITPVAVSTQLPAAVAQLSQQGNIPGRPAGGRHGMVFGQISIPSSAIGQTINTPLVPGGTPLVLNQTADRKNNVNTNFGSSNVLNHNNTLPGMSDQFSTKAKQEVYIIQRVQELQREGLWMEKRLPKLQEPSRQKVHWDYLLEEMQWLAQDFAQERKWKKAAAKKCARMVQKHFQDKQVAAQKAEKAQEQHLKRIAAFIAKEIKTFWGNVEKLVEYKQNTKLEEKRKKVLDQQLSFIVDQTEKYSMQLAEGMNKPHTSKATSLNSSRISSPTPKPGGSDCEFRPDEASDDDEETIAQAEAEINVNTNEEVNALQKESEMDLDDFLKSLPKDYLQNRDQIVLSDCSDEEEAEEDIEFRATEDSTDDEGTIMEQEKNERQTDHQAEIEELNADNEMTIAELVAKYKTTDRPKNVKLDSDDDSPSEEMDIDSDEETEWSDDDNKTNEELGLKGLLDEQQGNTENSCDKDDLIDDVAAIAESIQPKGNTLSSTSVVTPIPFLLKHTLREYQHIGLDWLVTMHDRKLNGILADEMGLGKTIQTIALLGHLACVKGNWGPHLIIVPSSVMLNWEMEFKKWCPGFKILVYYGSQKERKVKRTGWTKHNAFHVCITSYKLVIQDHQSFRRKKWKYLILDEAQNIKNFKSQRWQLLLNFQTEQRLLLTGTPLQNNLMELWSLMHFLMPNVFQSHREFKEWFSNPMTGMIEGNSEYNESIIKRLHKVLRPFLLRRLKCEVEKQMPKKYEHVVMCRLSNRQRFLYDDFMSRAKTRETLASGNLLSVINVLMQLRKVCNHPNLFEVRPTVSPFRMDRISLNVPAMVYDICQYDPLVHIDIKALNLVLLHLETCLTAYVAYRIKKLATPKKLIEEIDSLPELPPHCPSRKYKLHIRIKPTCQERIASTFALSQVKVGTSPAMKCEGNNFVPLLDKKRVELLLEDDEMNGMPVSTNSQAGTGLATSIIAMQQQNFGGANVRRKQMAQILQTSSGKHIILTPSIVTQGGQRVLLNKSQGVINKTFMNVQMLNQQPPLLSQPLASALIQHVKQEPGNTFSLIDRVLKPSSSEFYLKDKETLRKEHRQNLLHLLSSSNRRKCEATPIYGSDLRESLAYMRLDAEDDERFSFLTRSFQNCHLSPLSGWSLSNAIKSVDERTSELKDLFNKFVIFVPAVSAHEPGLAVSHMHPSKRNEEEDRNNVICQELAPKTELLHPIASAMSTQFPDPRLIQYDCGKLQAMDHLLRKLKPDGHRVLVFTQMTRMLDVLEAFLNYHGHIYLRLDGTTKVEQRQILMERFNGDKRIFVFILSTRSGGVGVNLTGADTVIFYDSDWNPTMDAQAQDRCHRIGQTRDVHIYRLVSEKTIEENILKKANQKRLLGDLAIEGGNFTTAFFKTSTIQDLFNVDQSEGNANSRLAEFVDRDRERRERLTQSFASTSLAEESSSVPNKTTIGAFESALAAAEDDQDVQAATTAAAEAAEDLAEFDENIPITEDSREPEMSKAEKEVQNLIKQLSPIERYAMRFVEETEGTWTATQLKAVEMEIEQQKLNWEANRLAEQKQEQEDLDKAEKEDDILTFSRDDALNKVNKSNKKLDSKNARKVDEACGLPHAGKHTRNGLIKKREEQEDNNRNVKDQSRLNRSKRIVVTSSVETEKRSKLNVAEPITSKRNTRNRFNSMKSNASITINNEKPTYSESDLDSKNSKKSAEESDSECSLDVMIDSNDVNDSDSTSTHQVNNFTSSQDEDATLLNDSNNDTNESKMENGRMASSNNISNNLSFVAEVGSTSSPRTRSRGSVKINLWTLDESPILPPNKRQRTNHSKSNSNNALESKSNDQSDLIDDIDTKELDETLKADFGIKELTIVVDDHMKRPGNKTKSLVKKKRSKSNLGGTKNHTLDIWMKSGTLTNQPSLQVAAKKTLPKLADGTDAPPPLNRSLRSNPMTKSSHAESNSL